MGEWRQAALDELAALVAGVDADFGQARDASPSVRRIRILAVMCLSDSAIDAREQRFLRACGSQLPAAVCKKVTAK